MSGGQMSMESLQEESDASFMQRLEAHHREKGTLLMREPLVSGHVVSLHAVWREMIGYGGYEACSQRGVWRAIGDSVLPVSAATCTNKAFLFRTMAQKNLLSFEQEQLGTSMNATPQSSMREAGPVPQYHAYYGGQSQAYHQYPVQQASGSAELGEYMSRINSSLFAYKVPHRLRQKRETYLDIGVMRPQMNHAQTPFEMLLASDCYESRRRFESGKGPSSEDAWARVLLSLRSTEEEDIYWALTWLMQVSNAQADHLKLTQLPGLGRSLLKIALLADPKRDPSLEQLESALEAALVLRNSALTEENAVVLSQESECSDFLKQALSDCLRFGRTRAQYSELGMYALEIFECLTKHRWIHLWPDLGEIQLLIKDIMVSSDDRMSQIMATWAAARMLEASQIEGAQVSRSLQDELFQKAIYSMAVTDDDTLVAASSELVYTYTRIPANLERVLSGKRSSVIRLLFRLLKSEVKLQEHVKLAMATSNKYRRIENKKDPTETVSLPKGVAPTLAAMAEPGRASEWMRLLFVADPQGEITQVAFWTSYRDQFQSEQVIERLPMLAAADLIKSVNNVFSDAVAMVTSDNPPRFIIRGIRARTDIKDRLFRSYTSTMPVDEHGEAAGISFTAALTLRNIARSLQPWPFIVKGVDMTATTTPAAKSALQASIPLAQNKLSPTTIERTRQLLQSEMASLIDLACHNHTLGRYVNDIIAFIALPEHDEAAT